MSIINYTKQFISVSQMLVECHNILSLSLFSQNEFYCEFFFSSGPSWITLIPSGHLSHTQCICCSDAIFQMMVLIQPWCLKYFPCFCNTLTVEGVFTFLMSARTWSACLISLPMLTSESLPLAPVPSPSTSVFGILFPSVHQIIYFIIQLHFIMYVHVSNITIYAVFLYLILHYDIIHICK